ncbi:MAG: CDP-archaeol synthase [Solobacterium sp.]|nr:CDP-archaeol synthase [Solobacterium sp.]MBQ9825117.1 CDP-archaeol synthase [Solobacterium sp.]
MNKKMLVKTLVALAMIAVVVPIVIIGGIPLQILLGVIAAMAAYETARLFDKNPYVMAALGFGAIAGLYYVPASHLAAVIALWLVILFAIELCDENITTDLVAYTFTMTMLTGLAIRCVQQLYNDPSTAVYVLLYIACACFGCDTGAYFFGVFFGKHKMIPRVSPNKTWEGAVGGYATGAVMSFVWGLFFCAHLPVTLRLAGSLILPAVAQLGDLAFSSIKRRFGVKDLGNVFPGHGGILDRVDSIIFCLMVFNGLMILWGLA